LRRDLLKVAEACGVEHPALIDADHVELADSGITSTSLRDSYGYRPEWARPAPEIRQRIEQLMRGTAPQGGTAPPSPTAVDGRPVDVR